MNDKNTRRTLLPHISGQAVASVMSGLFGLAAVAMIALGVAMIYVPAGVITAGVGVALLQWQFFSGSQG